MISPASPSGRSPRPETIATPGTATARHFFPRPDRISTESAILLRSALARQTEIRPEVVARARALAADPAYPPLATIKRVAQQILAAPDLSESEA